MKRHWLLAVLICTVLPNGAQAQAEPTWGPVLRITPTLGISPTFKQSGDATIVSPTDVTVHRFQFDYPSGLPVGVNVELRFWNRFSLIAGGVWSARGDGEVTDFEEEVTYQTAGTNFWLAKAGLAVRLNEVRPAMQRRQLNASIFVAPALIRDVAKSELFAPVSAANTIEHFGVNLGAEGELPLGSEHLAFTVGVEDWLIYWNDTDEEYLTRVGAYLEQGFPRDVVSVEADRSHLWVLRVGLSFRF